jgi:hypothetical protein
LNVSCYASPNPANSNQSVNFISSANGGTGNYSYSWSGACSGSSQTCTNSFSGSGNQTATVNVTSGSQTDSASCSVNINQQNNVSVQTNSATNVYNNQATLNGYMYGNDNNNNVYVWFQWGTSTSYGNETTHQSKNYSGTFNQNIANLNNNTTYHFRAVAQSNNGQIVYGQDMTFYTGGSNQNLLTITKTARNMTSGNTGFSTTIYANPSDTLMFLITIQATGNQDVQNVVVRDYLANNLIYKNQLIVSGATNYTGSYNYGGGDITSGINLGTIPSGQTITITYQTQVAGSQNFAFGTTTLTNSVSATSSNSTNNPTSNASVIVTKTAVYGASSISTGLTNNLWLDSFFLPMLVALVGIMMMRSGMFLGIEKWADNNKKRRRVYKAEKELNSRITKIRKTENI